MIYLKVLNDRKVRFWFMYVCSTVYYYFPNRNSTCLIVRVPQKLAHKCTIFTIYQKSCLNFVYYGHFEVLNKFQVNYSQNTTTQFMMNIVLLDFKY